MTLLRQLEMAAVIRAAAQKAPRVRVASDSRKAIPLKDPQPFHRSAPLGSPTPMRRTVGRYDADSVPRSAASLADAVVRDVDLAQLRRALLGSPTSADLEGPVR